MRRSRPGAWWSESSSISTTYSGQSRFCYRLNGDRTTPSTSTMLSSSLRSVVLFVAGAAAHGAVTSYTIAGKEYPGCVSLRFFYLTLQLSG